MRLANASDVDEVVRQRLAFLATVRDDGVEADANFVDATRQFVEEEAAAGRMRSWLAEHEGNPNWLERRVQPTLSVHWCQASSTGSSPWTVFRRV